MAKSKNQRRLERLVAAGGKASMAALVALPIACGDANAPSAKATARVSKKGETREDVFARLDAAAAFNASTNIALSAGACDAGDVPSSTTGLCASGQPSTNKKNVLNVSISATNTAPVKVSTRAADGMLLIDGKEAVVLEQSGWVVKTYRFKASTTTVVVKGGALQDNVIVDLSSRSGPKAVDFGRLSSEATATSSDNLYVKGSAGADTASVLADGSVKVGSTLFFADSATPASLNLMLGAGDDVYDGSKFVGYKTAAGTHLTYDLAPVYIYGQEGNDTFFSGAAIEWFVGGAGVDTVKSLGFTKNGDVYATSGGLDAAGGSTVATAATGFVEDSTLEAAWFPDTSTNPEKGYTALPFYDTLRADVLDLSGWLGAATKFHGASGEDAATGSLFGAGATGNDWAVNGDDFRPAQGIAGLVIDASKTIAGGGDPALTNEVYLAAWPAGVHGSVTGTAVTYYGLAKLHNEVADTNDFTAEEYFSEFRAPRTSVTFTGDERAEKFVQSAVPFADNLKGAAADFAAKDTISYELRTRPVKVDFTFYGKGGDGDSATWNDSTFTTWNDGAHVVPDQGVSANVGYAIPVHGEGYYVGAPQNRVFVVTEADSLDGFHNVIGGAGSDWLIGSQGPNVLSGGPGNDMIEGYGGNDLISGGPGADLLDGGDRYSTATLTNEYDVLDYSGAAAGVTVDLQNAQQSLTLSGLNDTELAAGLRTTLDAKKKVADGDLVWRFEGVKGSAFADTLTAKATGSILAGGAGNDTLTAAAGAPDLLLGGDGDDYIEVVEADDAIDAGAGDDILDSADGTLDNAWTTVPSAATTWDTNQPTSTATELQAIASLPNDLWAYPRMSQYVATTTYDPTTIASTFSEHTFTCGSGSDIVSWSRLSSRDTTATGAKDLISCNDEFPAQK